MIDVAVKPAIIIGLQNCKSSDSRMDTWVCFYSTFNGFNLKDLSIKGKTTWPYTANTILRLGIIDKDSVKICLFTLLFGTPFWAPKQSTSQT